LYVTMHYIVGMPKTRAMQVRLTDPEKAGFEEAAHLAGIPLSSWVRERLRLAAIRELENAGRSIPFISDVPLGGTDD
jgi:hypothetical protein